jgi:hypothetical protein
MPVDAQSGNNRTHRVPAATAAVLAAIGIATFLFTHFGPKADVQPGGISMISTVAVERQAPPDSDEPRAGPASGNLRCVSRRRVESGAPALQEYCAAPRSPRQMPAETATCGKPTPEEAVAMSKPVKTEAELIAMAKAELKVHADGPDGIVISVLRDGDSWSSGLPPTGRLQNPVSRMRRDAGADRRPPRQTV